MQPWHTHILQCVHPLKCTSHAPEAYPTPGQEQTGQDCHFWHFCAAVFYQEHFLAAKIKIIKLSPSGI